MSLVFISVQFNKLLEVLFCLIYSNEFVYYIKLIMNAKKYGFTKKHEQINTSNVLKEKFPTKVHNVIDSQLNVRSPEINGRPTQ